MTYRLPNSRKSNFATEAGEKPHKRWKKLHMGVDTQGRIVASTIAESPGQDPSQVPALWSHVDRAIDRFIGEGMDDQAPVYAAVMVHSPGASVIIPPRTDAVVSDQAATVPTQRDHHLVAIERAGRLAWKRTSGYDAQSHAEHAFVRCKPSFGGRGRAKREASQAWETSLACALLNRMRDLGCPESYAVS